MVVKVDWVELAVVVEVVVKAEVMVEQEEVFLVDWAAMVVMAKVAAAAMAVGATATAKVAVS